uniref:Uncharacterized protein n=1 Tax=Romanomermis culicivorax TaxID=13658 RepID=A0A915J655_ROMCU
MKQNNYPEYHFRNCSRLRNSHNDREKFHVGLFAAVGKNALLRISEAKYRGRIANRKNVSSSKRRGVYPNAKSFFDAWSSSMASNRGTAVQRPSVASTDKMTKRSTSRRRFRRESQQRRGEEGNDDRRREAATPYSCFMLSKSLRSKRCDFTDGDDDDFFLLIWSDAAPSRSQLLNVLSKILSFGGLFKP